MKQYALLQLCTRCIIVLSAFLFSCKKEEPKPTPVPPVSAITVTAVASPNAIAYGGKSKISVTAENAASITISVGDKVIKTGNSGPLEVEVEELVATTKYTIIAKSADGKQSKETDITITVAPIHPKLKLFLDGKWQLVKTLEMTKWSGATDYTEIASKPCLLDNIYSFPTWTTCIADWGTSNCFDYEKTDNRVHFKGYNPDTGILEWFGSDLYDVLLINETTLRIHKQISTFGDFNQKTDRIEEYRNVAK